MNISSNNLPARTIQDKSHAKAREDATILADIYRDEVNIAVWQNSLPATLHQSAKSLVAEANAMKAVMTVTPQNVVSCLFEHSGYLASHKELCQHIGLLVDMFCTLFELKRVGLRLTKLDHAMCPKFHVDRIPCRLITTFAGVATQWLPNDLVNRDKLGLGSLGLPDESSGIMRSPTDIQQLQTGDVALLKGEGWYNNEGGGLVHRSPTLTGNQQRLVLTLDFID